MSTRIQERAVVSNHLAGKRFDQAAAAMFPEYSRARLQAWIRQGALTIDGVCAKPTTKVRGGEVFSLDAEIESQAEAAPQDIPLDIIHADEDIIVLNKPAGLVVHPAPGHHDETLLNALLYYDNSLAELPRAGLVHRLDRDTTGVMVVARSLRAHTSLVRQLQSRSMSRIYRAIVIGVPLAGDTVDQPIGRHPKSRKRMAVVRNGKPAVTHFRVLERFRGFASIEVSLETGRTHQIRVHMTHLGYPLLGDPVYGRRLPKLNTIRALSDSLVGQLREFPRQALHASRLRLAHPGSHGEREFEAPLPDDMMLVLSALRSGAPPES